MIRTVSVLACLVLLGISLPGAAATKKRVRIYGVTFEKFGAQASGGFDVGAPGKWLIKNDACRGTVTGLASNGSTLTGAATQAGESFPNTGDDWVDLSYELPGAASLQSVTASCKLIRRTPYKAVVVRNSVKQRDGFRTDSRAHARCTFQSLYYWPYKRLLIRCRAGGRAHVTYRFNPRPRTRHARYSAGYRVDKGPKYWRWSGIKHRRSHRGKPHPIWTVTLTVRGPHLFVVNWVRLDYRYAVRFRRIRTEYSRASGQVTCHGDDPVHPPYQVCN